MTSRKKKAPKTPYQKPALSFPDQLKQLKARGMIVEDEAEALHYLAQLNYYRLGAYWLPFEQDHQAHTFKPDTTFNDVLNLYIFDRELRLLIMDAIERIEVSIRSLLACKLGHRYGSHAHLNPNIFFDPISYGRSITKLDQDTKRSGEGFIKHLTNKYEEQLPPIWAVVELMTMGQLSKWYGNVKERQDRKAIADSYDMDEKTLRSFLQHLTTIRNHCAHHSRVWNREFTFTFSIPNKRPNKMLTSFHRDGRLERKLYNTLVMLAYMMDCVCPGHHWKMRLINLLKSHEINVTGMGFPGDWQTRAIWLESK